VRPREARLLQGSKTSRQAASSPHDQADTLGDDGVEERLKRKKGLPVTITAHVPIPRAGCTTV